MKAYTDIFKKPLTKNEVRQAVAITLKTGYADSASLCRQMGIGYTKASRLAKLMYDAGILVDSTFRGTTVILKTEAQATNAAFRQLKKGKRG